MEALTGEDTPCTRRELVAQLTQKARGLTEVPWQDVGCWQGFLQAGFFYPGRHVRDIAGHSERQDFTMTLE